MTRETDRGLDPTRGPHAAGEPSRTLICNERTHQGTIGRGCPRRPLLGCPMRLKFQRWNQISISRLRCIWSPVASFAAFEGSFNSEIVYFWFIWRCRDYVTLNISYWYDIVSSSLRVWMSVRPHILPNCLKNFDEISYDNTKLSVTRNFSVGPYWSPLYPVREDKSEFYISQKGLVQKKIHLTRMSILLRSIYL
jgi:hypothetical protein